MLWFERIKMPLRDLLRSYPRRNGFTPEIDPEVDHLHIEPRKEDKMDKKEITKLLTKLTAAAVAAEAFLDWLIPVLHNLQGIG